MTPGPARMFLLAAAGFVVALAATAPARFALQVSPVAASGLSADAVEGSIWNGRLRGARFGGLSLGDLDVRLLPLSVLTGRPSLAFRANGAVEGAGRLPLTGGAGLERFSGSAPLEALNLATPLSGRLTLSQVDAVFGAAGCLKGGGAIGTDAFRNAGAQFAVEGPELTGDVSCAADGALVAPLTGANASMSVTATLRLYGDGRMSLETLIATADPSLSLALPLAGFAAGPAGFARMDQGWIIDARSGSE